MSYNGKRKCYRACKKNVIIDFISAPIRIKSQALFVQGRGLTCLILELDFFLCQPPPSTRRRYALLVMAIVEFVEKLVIDSKIDII